MDLKQWREQQRKTKKVTLPSGLDVEVRSVSFQAFLRSGIPDTLTPLIMGMMEKGTLPKIESLDSLRAYYQMLDAIAMQAIVTPRVVEGEPADDEINISELTEMDKNMLMSLLGATAKQLETFRYEPEMVVEPVQADEGDEPAAE